MRQRAAGQIAEAIGQIRVVALDQRVVAEAAILPEGDFAQQEIAQRVGADHVHDRAPAAPHCRATCSFCFLRAESSRAQIPSSAAADRRPSETPANKRRESAECPCRSGADRQATDRHPSPRSCRRSAHRTTRRRRVSCHRRRNAPLNVGARDGKIVQPLLDERDHLVAPVIRLHELRDSCSYSSSSGF